MGYDAIIFDVSDTLVEYSPNYARIYGDRLRSLKFEITEEKAREISRAVNLAIGEQVRREENGEPRMLGKAVLKDKAALSCVIGKESCMQEHLDELSKIPIPKQKMSIIHGVIDVLTILKRKYRLAIVSNHHPWLMDYLEESGLASFFESIIISDVVGVAKPNIRIMQIVLEELNLKAEYCLYVGDQPIDVQCSKEAGMDCAWIVTDENELPESFSWKEDYRIKKLSELLNIL